MELAGIIEETRGSGVVGATAFDALADLLERVVPRKRLSDFDAKVNDLPEYADKVIETQQRLLKNNFVPFEKSDLMDVYRAAY